MILFLPNFTINVTILILKFVNFPFLMVIFLALYPMEVIFLTSSNLLEHLATLLTSNTRNKLFAQRLLKQSYWYHKFGLTFSKFYSQYYNLIPKFHIRLKSSLRQVLLEPEFYGELENKLKTIVGTNNCSAVY